MPKKDSTAVNEVLFWLHSAGEILSVFFPPPANGTGGCGAGGGQAIILIKIQFTNCVKEARLNL